MESIRAGALSRNMITESFYLSEESNHDRACSLLEISLDEIESIVGRFGPRSARNGKLKGEVVVFGNGKILIRNHFSKKKIWESGLVALHDLDERF